MLVAVLLIAALALLPLWRTSAATSFDHAVRVVLSLLAVAAVVVATTVGPEPPPASTTRPIEENAAGYAGSQSCRSCHPAQHASWHGSFHRTMTQVATRAAVVATFDRLELDWLGSPVVLEWRGDRLWTKFTRRGRRPAVVERPIEQLTGSHHLQVFWYSTGEGRELGPMPLCYKIEEGIWLPLNAVFVLPPEYTDPPEPGSWNQSCTMCHTTDARPRVDVGVTDTHVGEFGIACEACHGPGAAHVAANKNPIRRYGARLAGADDTIVDPAALLPARSAEVCGHCHSVSILRQEHFDSWRQHGSPFVPGQSLQSTHLVIDRGDRDAPELRRELQQNPNFFASSFWSDGQVRLSGREFSGLRQSPCYTHGDRERQIDCTSCHALHTEDGSVPDDWRDDQLRPGMRGNTACTQCHEALAEPVALSAHTRHGPESLGSSCYDCHMGHTVVGLMKASRSHAITSPSVANEIATGRPNACNQCHLDRTLAWTAERLQQWWGHEVPELTAEQRDVAAGVRWILTGDAGQRMLAAWSFGWEAAQRTAGTDWLAPYLARLLDDPYYVVRFRAARALRHLPAGGDALAGYDFLGPQASAAAHGDRVTAAWARGYRGTSRTPLLLTSEGLDRAAFDRLYARRDDRPVYLAE